MANSASKPALVKQLKEHLQEQQEPFNLSTYLSERRYTMKSLSSRDGNRHCLTSATENYKEPCSRGFNKRILQAPRTLKLALYKLITPKDRQELATCNKAAKDKLISETIDLIQKIAETNWFSNDRNVTTFNASPDYGAPEVCPPNKIQNGSPEETYQASEANHFEEHKTLADKNKEPGCMDADKQLNPVTELQDIKIYDEGVSTWSLSLTQAKELKEIIRCDPPRYTRSKRGMQMQQSNRLLFNCITEAIRNYVWNNQSHLHKFFNLEEPERITGQFSSWEKKPVNNTNAACLVNLDFPNSSEEWNSFQQLKGKIGREMVDSIMDEIIGELIDLLYKEDQFLEFTPTMN